MHGTFLRVAEIVLYTLLNSIPYHLCVLYVFRGKLRFGAGTAAAILTVPTLLEMALNLTVVFAVKDNSSLVNITWSLAYIAAYCLIIREPIGKISFVMLVMLNINNFNIVASKCLESFFFPTLAMERFHLSNSLTMVVVELLLVLPHFVTLHRRYVPAMKRTGNIFLWRYLWLVPAIFYFLWHYHIHFNAGSSLEVATDLHAVLFLFVINCGSYLIYYIVLRLVNESADNASLRSNNHQLELQTLQFENLQDRINETRKANHDLRHHITMMQSYLEKEDYPGLRQYFSTLKAQTPGGNLHYCQHYTLNMLLAYFSQLSKENGIACSIKANIPAQLPIPDNDLAVLIGNLVENALEACIAQTKGEKKLLICGQTQGNKLLFTIDNTFDRPVRKDLSGVFLSSKHVGHGIGIESAKAIVLRYNGQLRIEQNDGMFCVSLLIDL